MNNTDFSEKALAGSYSALTTLALPFLLAGFSLSSRGRIRLSERFGRWKFGAPMEVVWFHGASAGEVNGLLPIIKRFREVFPEKKILLSATSLSGLKVGRHLADFDRLLPFDSGFLLKRAFKNLTVTAFISAETEIWPNLIKSLEKKKVPIVFVNARISEFTYPYYRILRPLVRQSLRKCKAIGASNEEVARRFQSLGANKTSLVVLGNAKYDLQPRVSSSDEAKALMRTFFSSDLPTITLGSLRPGEEQVWFPAIKEMVDHQRINVVIAPRHKEKFSFFEAELKKLNLPFAKRSEATATQKHIMLLDTFGELESVYSFSKMAFIGGSIARFGGHNPMEAAPYRCALLIGPHYGNVREIVDPLLSVNGIKIVADESQAQESLQLLVSDNRVLAEMGEKAFSIWQEHSCASKRIFDFLEHEVFSQTGIAFK